MGLIYLAAYKGQGKLFNRLIRLWTRSRYSHCELVMPDGRWLSASAMDGGVREKYIELNLEHWDLFGPEYLMGCASKYVSRHMEKGGREDLEKAVHYCEKLGEVLRGRTLTNTPSTSRLLEWAAGAQMRTAEIIICNEILCLVRPERAIELLRQLIASDYPEEPRPKRAVELLRPGTPEDGGHHARQPLDEEPIVSYDGHDIALQRLPPSLSPHEWQHRCTEDVHQKYEYNVSAARYLIREQHRELCKFCVVDRE